MKTGSARGGSVCGDGLVELTSIMCLRSETVSNAASSGPNSGVNWRVVAGRPPFTLVTLDCDLRPSPLFIVAGILAATVDGCL